MYTLEKTQAWSHPLGAPNANILMHLQKRLVPALSYRQTSTHVLRNCKWKTRQTGLTLVYFIDPVLGFLETECGLGASVVRVLINMKNLLIRPRKSPAKQKDVSGK